MLGHDLRNPLASLGAGVHLLLKAPKGASETSILTMMQAAGFRMAALIDNLLDFARARLGGAFPLERRNEDLVPVLHQVVDELRTAMPHRVIEERYDIGGPVSFDRTRIGQLVSNLLANALTHGAQDQPVRIEATAEGTLAFDNQQRRPDLAVCQDDAVRAVLPGRCPPFRARPRARPLHRLGDRESPWRDAGRDVLRGRNEVHLPDAIAGFRRAGSAWIRASALARSCAPALQ